VFICGFIAFCPRNSLPFMPNRLAFETSPYLQQHAENPVDWYPWGPEALAESKKTGKPILLSVGYSACHWCHVMAHESFEDEAIARVMNELFVNIKVDREERPDIDQIYQVAQAMLTQRNGGWPLTMFLTPDQVPFFGGTYFRTRRATACRDSASCSRACASSTTTTPRRSARRTSSWSRCSGARSRPAASTRAR
jgi:uncharacterized protein YyaL (SSP411 family)